MRGQRRDRRRTRAASSTMPIALPASTAGVCSNSARTWSARSASLWLWMTPRRSTVICRSRRGSARSVSFKAAAAGPALPGRWHALQAAWLRNAAMPQPVRADAGRLAAAGIGPLEGVRRQPLRGWGHAHLDGFHPWPAAPRSVIWLTASTACVRDDTFSARSTAVNMILHGLDRDAHLARDQLVGQPLQQVGQHVLPGASTGRATSKRRRQAPDAKLRRGGSRSCRSRSASARHAAA